MIEPQVFKKVTINMLADFVPGDRLALGIRMMPKGAKYSMVEPWARFIVNEGVAEYVGI